MVSHMCAYHLHGTPTFSRADLRPEPGTMFFFSVPNFVENRCGQLPDTQNHLLDLYRLPAVHCDWSLAVHLSGTTCLPVNRARDLPPSEVQKHKHAMKKKLYINICIYRMYVQIIYRNIINYMLNMKYPLLNIKYHRLKLNIEY